MTTFKPARHLFPGLLAMSCALPVLAAEGGFVEDAKQSGWVAQAFVRHQIQGAAVAPAGYPTSN